MPEPQPKLHPTPEGPPEKPIDHLSKSTIAVPYVGFSRENGRMAHDDTASQVTRGFF